MGISPKLLQSGAEQIVLLLGLLVTALLVQFVPAIQIRLPRPRLPRGPKAWALFRVVPALGLVAAGALPSGAAVLQRKPRPSWAQASSQVETDGLPPLPSVRPRRIPRSAPVHPAIHRDAPLVAPLFPRARTARVEHKRRSRAKEIHPAGKELSAETYEVKLGDTLWDIAARVLKTDDPARIARFWPKLHRANLETLGKDPNRIFPGQMLRLPTERP